MRRKRGEITAKRRKEKIHETRKGRVEMKNTAKKKRTKTTIKK